MANDADDRRYNDRHVCRHFSGGQKYYQPRNCFHCAEPPCLTAAIVKRPDGIVDIVQDLCTGCGNCVPACPYDAIEMNIVAPILPPGLENGHGAADVAPRVAGVVEKCSFCVHRIDADLAPACVAACPTQVIIFGDLNDSESAVSAARTTPGAFRIDEETGADPSVWFIPATTGMKQRRSG